MASRTRQASSTLHFSDSAVADRTTTVAASSALQFSDAASVEKLALDIDASSTIVFESKLKVKKKKGKKPK